MFTAFRFVFVAILSMAALQVASADPVGFLQTNLASDQMGVAKFTDANLVNPWGIAASGSSPFWLGVNGSGVSLLYNGAGVQQSLIVTIPGEGSVTGVAFNNVAGNFNGDTFLFASEDGTVSGWRGALGTAAETLALPSDNNSYKGLTDASVGGNQYAYLANFKTGAVDVLKGSAAAPDLAGSFVDPNLPSGYAPFNVLVLGGSIYVTYAVVGPTGDDVAAAGNGIVDKYNLNGTFVGRLVTGGLLNSPWGLAIAPAGFGDLGGDLLVGNFGDGRIHAYNPNTGAFVETLTDAHGNPLAIDGLWALQFGNGGAAGPASTLFFTAGPDEESHGLFGALTAVPEPSAWFLTGFSLLSICVYSRLSAAKKFLVSRRNNSSWS
jgi:uncharacterized protein (TIGR03118 family)